MVDTALEIECRNCNNTFWYDGEKTAPNTVECPECNRKTDIIPEDG